MGKGSDDINIAQQVLLLSDLADRIMELCIAELDFVSGAILAIHYGRNLTPDQKDLLREVLNVIQTRKQEHEKA